MKPFPSSDSRYFTQTSNESYTRHQYKIVKLNGEYIIVDSWEEAQSIWWNTPVQFLSHIEIFE